MFKRLKYCPSLAMTKLKEYHRNLTTELSSFDFNNFELSVTRKNFVLTTVTIPIPRKAISTGKSLSMVIKSVIVYTRLRSY